MTDSRSTTRDRLERVGRTVGYLLLGLLGTAAVALGLLWVTTPVQSVLYRALYLALGPSDATATAILLQFLAVSAVAVAVPLVVGDYLDSGLANRDALVAALAVLVGSLVVFLAAAFGGFAATPVAFGLLALALLAVPLLLRFRYGVRSGAVPAFVGGIPVVLLLLLLVGFGLGWGWGYVVTADEVPASTVDDADVTTLDDAPALEAALFDPGNCDSGSDGRECYLYLRGFAHERAAARALADRGVRCPYQGSSAGGGTAVVRHDGRYYRVACSPHGD